MARVSRTAELRTGLYMPFFQQGDSSGVPLVLLHGLGDSRRIFRGLLDHLPPSLNSFAPTLRGHAGATRPASGYRSADLATDLALFMDSLDIRAAIVAGASSGGLVAQRFAIDYPERALGIALLGSPYILGNKPSVWEMWDSTFSKLADPISPDFVRSFIEGMLTRPMPAALLDDAVEEGLRVPAFVWKAVAKGTLEDDFSAELHRIAAPTVIVWGDRDTLLSRDDQETLRHLIPGARLLVYPGAGHLFYWEEPDRTAADLASFAEAVASGEA